MVNFHEILMFPCFMTCKITLQVGSNRLLMCGFSKMMKINDFHVLHLFDHLKRPGCTIMLSSELSLFLMALLGVNPLDN